MAESSTKELEQIYDESLVLEVKANGLTDGLARRAAIRAMITYGMIVRTMNDMDSNNDTK